MACLHTSGKLEVYTVAVRESCTFTLCLTVGSFVEIFVVNFEFISTSSPLCLEDTTLKTLLFILCPFSVNATVHSVSVDPYEYKKAGLLHSHTFTFTEKCMVRLVSVSTIYKVKECT